MSYRVEALADHDLSGFACGKAELDDWLRRHARTATGQGTRTFVLVDEDGGVVGYFALAPHLLVRDGAPARLARGAAHQIPAILLAELAVDSRLHGTGLGVDLLVHALGTILDAARSAGGRVVLVDAVDDDDREFYERHDFQVLPGRPRRLVDKLSTVAKALGTPWPWDTVAMTVAVTMSIGPVRDGCEAGASGRGVSSEDLVCGAGARVWNAVPTRMGASGVCVVSDAVVVEQSAVLAR